MCIPARCLGMKERSRALPPPTCEWRRSSYPTLCLPFLHWWQNYYSFLSRMRVRSRAVGPAASLSPTRRFTPRLLRPLPPPTLRPRTALSQTSVTRWPLSRFLWQQQQPAVEQLLLEGAMPFREDTLWEEEDRVTPALTPVPLLLPSVPIFSVHFNSM